MKKKRCARIDDNGVVVEVFESATAAAKQAGASPSIIHECCRFGWKRRGSGYRYLNDDGTFIPLSIDKKPSVLYRTRMLAIIRKHYLPLLGQEAWDWAMERLDKALERKAFSTNLLGNVERLLVHWYIHQQDVFVGSDAFVKAIEETRADMMRQQGRKKNETKVDLD